MRDSSIAVSTLSPCLPCPPCLISTYHFKIARLLDRTVGLKWRSQQKSQVVDWFRIFATSHDWEV
ncbi:MAG: hypothetical protein QNJ34_22610 [Xenococcaceae cyanobacterium MO_188.B29]|nr:hypothetical protein [Xenococcaceae cyanobacterium MO_188.B29]